MHAAWPCAPSGVSVSRGSGSVRRGFPSLRTRLLVAAGTTALSLSLGAFAPVSAIAGSASPAEPAQTVSTQTVTSHAGEDHDDYAVLEDSNPTDALLTGPLPGASEGSLADAPVSDGNEGQTAATDAENPQVDSEKNAAGATTGENGADADRETAKPQENTVNGEQGSESDAVAGKSAEKPAETVTETANVETPAETPAPRQVRKAPSLTAQAATDNVFADNANIKWTWNEQTHRLSISVKSGVTGNQYTELSAGQLPWLVASGNNSVPRDVIERIDFLISG